MAETEMVPWYFAELKEQNGREHEQLRGDVSRLLEKVDQLQQQVNRNTSTIRWWLMGVGGVATAGTGTSITSLLT